ncbi:MULTISPECIES: hypothetical protein [Burkholderia cepacia complex]|uniref:hypothetical protein n=1 Tax=Burkholderia cepacia complex TaxID=87882 RepID=UPI0007552698|nr:MULTISPECIES: hypothetical protein [Burkholderia cepacia complex]KVH08876.1 hypothetical protein WS85_20630 [Burkholderia anthina]KVH10589.1 hypothetical protein WS84_13775 [Burkholderia anthina]KVM86673.1 hypothetical protein WT06_23550 [Burkholderia anthina]KVN51518.1 hypothetical protein WT13_33220 [Burkholderia anthina]KVX34337.1 hypothetical protein WT32_19290 [Burkholderia anthina]
MSDIAIDIPWPVMMLILGISYWPLWLLVGAGLTYFGVTRLRGIRRVACMVVAVLFIAYAGLGLYVMLDR